MSPEEAVRKFFDCYTDGRPEDFAECVAPDYADYGHEPPGIGPGGARDDYENAVKLAGGLIRYTIDALVAGGAQMKGLSLYRATGGLLRSTRHALIGDLPV